jgi:Ulp1 family protease
MIRALLYNDGSFTEKGELKPVMITPSFYTLLCSDTFDTCSWLKSCFRNLNLMIDDQLLPCTCLFPANIGGNSHWILIHVDIEKKTYFPINPYHPSTPNTIDIEVGEKIASCFSNYFNIEQLKYEAPQIVLDFPIQNQNDTSNCGVYVILYILAFFERPMDMKEILKKFSIQAYRLIITAWLLTKTIPQIPNTPK